ncbi:hypothetical protein ACLQ2R_30290 [Streptosporangium sp. DT93]|uniref:hypothetical protein n=1 Tax=Streptosporangium sp. DT93 TaxID=3393428 RepID=UPI003CF609AF
MVLVDVDVDGGERFRDILKARGVEGRPVHLRHSSKVPAMVMERGHTSMISPPARPFLRFASRAAENTLG